MSLAIVLDNSIAVYNPGESISGRVIANLTEPFTVKDIQLTIKGEAQFYWNESDQITENFFLSTITLWGNPSIASSSSTPILPAGRHKFEFSIPLTGKAQLPGTQHFEYGKIDYWIQARMERPVSKFDIKTERFFTVRPALMTNLPPEATLPQDLHGEKDICCWFCKAGRVDVTISFPKSVYANDEVIAVKIDITNQSPKIIDKVVMSLVQHIRYAHAVGHTHMVGDSVEFTRRLQQSVRRDPMKPKSQQLTNAELHVPPLAFAYPTMLAPMCTIINVRYTVEFEIHINGCVSNLEIQTPVIIGTIP